MVTEASDSDAEAAIRGLLDSTEILGWAGRPQQGMLLRPADACLIPFSLLWGGFAIFWEAGVIIAGAPIIFQLWGIPFVLVGLYMIAGRFLVDARQRGNTYYGVTNSRILIVAGILSRSVKSLSLRTLTDVTLVERSSGKGTITFGPVRSAHGQWAHGGWPGMQWAAQPCFEAIDDAKMVFDLIRKAQAAAA